MIAMLKITSFLIIFNFLKELVLRHSAYGLTSSAYFPTEETPVSHNNATKPAYPQPPHLGRSSNNAIWMNMPWFKRKEWVLLPLMNMFLG